MGDWAVAYVGGDALKLKWMVIFLVTFFSVLIVLTLSLLLPYAIVPIWQTLNKHLISDPTLIPSANYIQVVAAILSFLTATIISLSVFKLNYDKKLEESKKSAFILYHYVCRTVANIESFCDKTELLSFPFVDNSHYKMLFDLRLQKKDNELLVEYLQKIEHIGKIVLHSDHTAINTVCQVFREYHSKKKSEFEKTLLTIMRLF
jgi:hypothetical protein